MSVAYREGDPLLVRGEELPFSFWPLRRNERRWGRHSMLFTADPWAVIQAAVRERCPAELVDSAQSFVRQASEYYAAGNSAQRTEAQPLLHYYGFLNLAKALAITRGRPNLIGRVKHGLTTDPSSPFTSAQLTAFATGPPGNVNAFDEFKIALTGKALTGTSTLSLNEIAAQILFGHRLWVEAARRRERFIGIQRIEFKHIKDDSLIWLNLVIPERALVWRGRPKKAVVDEGDLAPLMDFVLGTIDDQSGTPLRYFQQTQPVVYGHRPSDDLMDLVDLLKPRLWRALSTGYPFRRYYLYLSEPGEARLPQLLSAFAFMFYLGSVTRYDPSRFEAILSGRYGAFVREFLASQPHQFVYEIACEFALQEVSKAAGV